MALRVLHVSKSDLAGGAARSAYRIHEALRESGIDSWMLVDDKRSDNPYVVTPKSWFKRKIQVLHARAERRLEKAVLKPALVEVFSIGKGGNTVLPLIKELAPDIINLHWINRGMVDNEVLKHIKVPIVWSLHDQWTFTGGCHYSGSCGKYTEGCGSCPMLKKSGHVDLSSKVVLAKLNAWAGVNMAWVGSSAWLTNSAQSSLLAQRLQVECKHLLTPINTKIFYRRDQAAARTRFGIPSDVPVLLFGATGGAADPRKGAAELKSALEHANWLPHDLHVAVFGGQFDGLKYPTINLGLLKTEEDLAWAYSAANMFAAPSLQDNLPNTVLESLACGTPVAGFDIGGLPDLVIQGKTGYLAPPFNTEALAKAIALTLAQSGVLSHHAEQFAQKELSYSTIAGKYHRLYHQLLS